MNTQAVVFEEPQRLSVRELSLVEPTPQDVVVAMRWSGISTGTEKLLFTGRMPPFPGLAYPLVPGYEGVGEIIDAGAESGRQAGQLVYVAGSKGFNEARGLFGGQASRVVVPGNKTVLLADHVGEKGALFALAATAHHCLEPDPANNLDKLPQLIVGHGALGRLIARLVVLYGAPAPTVWEVNPIRMDGARGYTVIHPNDDTARGYKTICDVSGADGIMDSLVNKLMPGGEIVLGGFYSEPVAFTFPPAFLREARIRIAAQWHPRDLDAITTFANDGRLDLDGLITHREPAARAADAYATAFGDPTCVKMILDWRSVA
ncbi:MAG: chlorophyll synthesis pathway protein BchC [Gemmatimonadaceae bacterium]|nr:chlorophyll synthesis pathway protein BchC [Gemmatimonadaceae bacterium]